jgi:glycosyltransferase involved in cell wall biosynthesis
MIPRNKYEKVFRSLWDIYKQKNVPKQNIHKRPGAKLAIVADGADWVLGWEAYELKMTCQRLGIKTVHPFTRFFDPEVSTFHVSQFDITNYKWESLRGRSGFAMFHGLESDGKEFKIIWDRIKSSRLNLSILQVSNHEMKSRLLQAGLNTDQIKVIPIGINPSFFWPQCKESKHFYRAKYSIPKDAKVIGSFQKDGEGWGSGDIPKLIKGPDIFLKAIKLLQAKIPNLFVLLTGPSRGYVKKGLKDMNIPFEHIYLNSYPEIGRVYQCLDAYIVASRIEGGPKSILESMASRVPIISTRVGQADDIITNSFNGWVCENENFSEIAEKCALTLLNKNITESITQQGLITASIHTYQMQSSAWSDLLQNLVSTIH